MDDETAWRIFNEGQPLTLLVNGRREEGAMVTGLNLPGFMTILLRTPVGERDPRIRAPIDEVELAQ
jgi:hypothetical protein